jgi:ABC-type glutathione transport system ATPase component
MPEAIAQRRPILEARDLVVLLGGRRRGLFKAALPPVRAVAGVSLALHAGETLGLVGESGCGKTTLGRALLGIQREQAGEIRLDGSLVSGREPREARTRRRAIQYVHQDAGAALDPWWSIGRQLEEGLSVHGVSAQGERKAKVGRMLEAVGLDHTFFPRYVHELSGGQLRRVALGRILLLQPRIVILDEPTSGLDPVSARAFDALVRVLSESLGLTVFIVTHDLDTLLSIIDRAIVLSRGKVIADGPVSRVRQADDPWIRDYFAARAPLVPEAS